MNTEFHTLKIKEVIKETSDTVSIRFDVPEDLKSIYAYKAGQYLTLKNIINGEDVRRSYSLSSAPSENDWKVAIKQVEGGKYSTFAQTLNAGDTVDVMPPLGNFTAESTEAKTYVLFAAGSGITPIISIAKFALKANSNNRVILFYGNKNVENTIYKSELDQLHSEFPQFEIHYVFSRQETENSTLYGRMDQIKVDLLFNAYLKEISIDDVYVCGPESMIHAVKNIALDRGLSEKQIHFELFVVDNSSASKSTSDAVPAGEINSQVTVIIDDEEYEFELSSKGDDILHAVIEQGADAPFSCQGGVCCTCKAKVMKGKASMEINYSLDADEVEEGYILTCQAHPQTEKLVVSFDEY